jgi:hypothetical protein
MYLVVGLESSFHKQRLNFHRDRLLGSSLDVNVLALRSSVVTGNGFAEALKNIEKVSSSLF